MDYAVDDTNLKSTKNRNIKDDKTEFFLSIDV